ARFAAIDGLGELNDPACTKLLRELTGEPQSLIIRYHAAKALLPLDPDAATAAAAVALARPDPDADPDELIQAFLVRKDGPEKLGAALEKHTLSEDTAKRLLRSMFLAGHSEPPLIRVISKYAGLEVATKPVTPADVQQLAAE